MVAMELNKCLEFFAQIAQLVRLKERKDKRGPLDVGWDSQATALGSTLQTVVIR